MSNPKHPIDTKFYVKFCNNEFIVVIIKNNFFFIFSGKDLVNAFK